ncbi:MAG: EFR1 family ferrodoxin [Syntrophomonadaceae bacterium]|nr:EFR1 family ferrodoxin [Syntrophomonadaceae bacterium]
MTTQVLTYYFTGTGNSLCASRWIAENASKAGVAAGVRPIDRFDRHSIPQPAPDTLLGFAYPTHGFNLPWYMLKFLLYFPRGHNPVFLLNTRAGMKLGRWYTPGVSGIAILLPMLILALKGYSIRGVLPLDMPSNWISIHPGLFPHTVADIVKHCRRIVDRFSYALLAKKRSFPLIFFLFLPLDLVLLPISLAYLVIGRFFLAKTFFASKRCNGCRICAEHCPVGAIQIIDERPYWSFHCESCMRCMNICPLQAIETSHSMAAIMITLTTSIPASIYLQHFLSATGLNITGAALDSAEKIISWLLSLVIIYVLYILAFALLRNPWVNRFFVYTSLTYYWARYKAPGIGLKDFSQAKIINKRRTK